MKIAVRKRRAPSIIIVSLVDILTILLIFFVGLLAAGIIQLYRQPKIGRLLMAAALGVAFCR